MEKSIMDGRQQEARETDVVETQQPEEAEIERPYTLRSLKDGDLFPVLKILRKIGIKDCKEAFVQVASGEKTL